MRSFSHDLQLILQLVKMGAVDTVSGLASLLFVFSLIQLKMWYSCGRNGRDRLWENLPYSVHVWFTVRTRWTKKHATYEGRNLLTVICVLGWGWSGRFRIFFSLLYRSFFVCPGNADIFSVVSSVRPNSDICEPEPSKDFCDVIRFVLLFTTEIKRWSYSLSDSCTSSRAGVSRNLARVLRGCPRKNR